MSEQASSGSPISAGASPAVSAAQDASAGTAPSDELAVRMVGVHKWFGQFHVLKDINLTVQRGERIVICGPSGSGKSTLIRCINRLEEHQQGTIIVDGTELSGDVKNIEHVRRETGMVFQHFNLFPHLSVLENLALAPIWVRKMPRVEAEEIAMGYLGAGENSRAGQEVPGPIVRWSATASGHCSVAVYEPQDHALRRAHFGVGSGDD